MLSDKWPCEAARKSENQSGLKVLRKAVLWNTFGSNTFCLEQYFSDSRLVSLQIHLINEVCQRNKQCADYEFLKGVSAKEYEEKLLSEDPQLMARLAAYLKAPSDLINTKLQAHTQCLISPGLESNLSRPAMKKLIKVVKPLFPKCKIVWNPVDSNPDAGPISGTIYEAHGVSPSLNPPCNANLDGVDINFPSRPAKLLQKIESQEASLFIERFKACKNSFLWIAEFNGIASEDFVDPRERREFPTAETFDLVNGLLGR